MNLSTLTTTVAQMTNDTGGARYAGLYTAALNLAQQQFAIDTKCLWKDAPTQTVISATPNYTLPTDFMWEKLVMFNGVPLDAVSRSELARTHRGTRWDTITGTPTKYNIDPEVGKDQILLFPIPTANDTKDLILTYYAFPTDMVNPTDVPLNSTTLLAQFHIALAAWAAWYLLLGEDSDAKIIANRRELLSIYNDSVSQCVETFKNTVSQPLRMRGVRIYG